MKKVFAMILGCMLVLSALAGCQAQTAPPSDTATATGTTAAVETTAATPEPESPYQTVKAEKQGFSTQCLKTCTTRWDDADGLYIYPQTEGSIPYVLLWRYRDIPIDAGQFLEESIYNQMVEAYGENLLDASPVKEYRIGGKTIPGILFTYKVDGHTLCSLRLAYQLGEDIINFTAKYIDGDGDLVLSTLDTVVSCFSLEDPSASEPTPGPEGAPAGEVVITPSESASVQYVPYTDANGYFTMDIPAGWTVKVGLPPDGAVDLISYAVTVSDPKNADRKLYFNLNCAGFLKSEEARDWYNTWYPDTFGTLPAVSDISAQGFFSVMGPYYGYTDFSVTENIGPTALNGDLLNATATSSVTGKPIRGLFTAMVTAMTNVVQKNPFDYTQGTVDAGFVSAYTVITETAPENEFVDWQPVLDHCLSSLTFSESFLSQRQAQWNAVMSTASYIYNTANEISDMIMDSWEKRNTAYDVISQKRSDATLGYDRVLDKETGNYYLADAGFGDVSGDGRYVVVDDDAAYLTPSSGWIEWKK